MDEKAFRGGSTGGKAVSAATDIPTVRFYRIPGGGISSCRRVGHRRQMSVQMATDTRVQWGRRREDSPAIDKCDGVGAADISRVATGQIRGGPNNGMSLRTRELIEHITKVIEDAVPMHERDQLAKAIFSRVL